MTENKRFEPDGNKNNHQYDYSILNSRYEANTKRNEIIEWNKDSCNAQYVGLERIAEKMNFKQMQLEECRKGYEKLYEENEQLKSVNMEYEDVLGRLEEENEQLKKEDELFFGKVFDILLKYQDLFNREMADEVLEELGIELTRWFE